MTVQTFTASETGLLRRVVDAIRAIEPSAQVRLYGSRARGDAEPDSDWDFLVLLDGAVDRPRIEGVRTALFYLSLAIDACPMLSAMVFSVEQWNTALYRAMPFHQSVDRDGLAL